MANLEAASEVLPFITVAGKSELDLMITLGLAHDAIVMRTLVLLEDWPEGRHPPPSTRSREQDTHTPEPASGETCPYQPDAKQRVLSYGRRCSDEGRRFS